jgi:hypothetical protein
LPQSSMPCLGLAGALLLLASYWVYVRTCKKTSKCLVCWREACMMASFYSRVCFPQVWSNGRTNILVHYYGPG